MFTGDERSLGKDLPKSWEFTANPGHLLRACAAGPRGWRTAWGTAGRAGRLGKSVNKKQYFKVLFLRFTLCSKSIHCIILSVSRRQRLVPESRVMLPGKGRGQPCLKARPTRCSTHSPPTQTTLVWSYLLCSSSTIWWHQLQTKSQISPDALQNLSWQAREKREPKPSTGYGLMTSLMSQKQ